MLSFSTGNVSTLLVWLLTSVLKNHTAGDAVNEPGNSHVMSYILFLYISLYFTNVAVFLKSKCTSLGFTAIITGFCKLLKKIRTLKKVIATKTTKTHSVLQSASMAGWWGCSCLLQSATESGSGTPLVSGSSRHSPQHMIGPLL